MKPYLELKPGALDIIRRAAGGKSITSIAADLGVDRSTWYRLAHGELQPSAGFVAAAALKYDLPISDLVRPARVRTKSVA